MNIFKIFFISLIIYTNIFGNFLNEKVPIVKEISKTNFEDLSSRKYEDIILDDNLAQEIKFSISYPKELKKNENVLILLDGLETGRNSLKYIPHPPNYILIGYEFPQALQRLRNKSVLFHLYSTRKAAMCVPIQLLCIVKWIEKQPWYNNKNVDIIGVSFGAIFVPATYHLAEKNNIDLGLGIIAYGGAGLYDIFYANLKKHKILRIPLAYLAYLTFKPLDPVFHLPYIHGKFLIINGLKDKSIPFKAAKKLQELTPEPKTIINLDTEHMSPEKQALINRVVNLSLKWLNQNK
jgi:hypothetical protein